MASEFMGWLGKACPVPWSRWDLKQKTTFQKEIHLPIIHFQVLLLLVSGRVYHTLSIWDRIHQTGIYLSMVVSGSPKRWDR